MARGLVAWVGLCWVSCCLRMVIGAGVLCWAVPAVWFGRPVGRLHLRYLIPPRTSLLEAPPGGCADCGLPAPSPVNASRQFQIVESGPRGALTYPGCDQVWCARVWMFAGASFGVSRCGGGRYVFLWRRLIFAGSWRGLRARWGMSGFGRGGWRGLNCCGLPRSTRRARGKARKAVRHRGRRGAITRAPPLFPSPYASRAVMPARPQATRPSRSPPAPPLSLVPPFEPFAFRDQARSAD